MRVPSTACRRPVHVAGCRGIDVCCPVASKDLARVRPSLLHGSRGINARPGRRSGARGLSEGPPLEGTSERRLAVRRWRCAAPRLYPRAYWLRLAAPKGLARALRLPLFVWGLTLGRPRRSGARGLSQGPPFHSRVRFACVAGEGAGVRGGQDKRDRGELLHKSCCPPTREGSRQVRSALAAGLWRRVAGGPGLGGASVGRGAAWTPSRAPAWPRTPPSPSARC